MPKLKKKWVEVKIHRLKTYPFRCSRIRFEMVDDGSEYDAVQMLMAYLDPGRYSFVETIDEKLPEIHCEVLNRFFDPNWDPKGKRK